MKLRLMIVSLVIALVLSVFAGSAMAYKKQSKSSVPSVVETILKRGTIRVGMDTFVPWAMKDKTGKLIGFEIDIAKKLAEDMGVKIEFVPTKWSGIIPALLVGKFDVIIGGMTITPARNLKVNFTEAYDFSGQTICVSKKLAPGFKTAADFNRADIKIAVRLGSTSVNAVRRFMPKAQMLQFNEEPQLYQELLNGNVHAVVASLPRPAYEALRFPDKLYALPEPFTTELIGFAVRKGDHDSMNFFNNWIKRARAHGFLHDRHNFWFNSKEWEGFIK